MRGKLYGVGIGPGEPGLITAQAQRLIEQGDVLAVAAGRGGAKGTARAIAEQAVCLEGKAILELPFRMDADPAMWEAEAARAGDCLIPYLDAGKQVVMAVLGDVTVYSTFLYVQEYVKKRGYETCMVPGISAYSAGAAKAGLGLLAGREAMAVLTAERFGQMMAEETAGKLLETFDTIVVMKAGRCVPEIQEWMDRAGLPADSAAVLSNIGMEDAYVGPMEPGRTYGYFTTVIIKKTKGEKA